MQPTSMQPPLPSPTTCSSSPPLHRCLWSSKDGASAFVTSGSTSFSLPSSPSASHSPYSSSPDTSSSPTPNPNKLPPKLRKIPSSALAIAGLWHRQTLRVGAALPWHYGAATLFWGSPRIKNRQDRGARQGSTFIVRVGRSPQHPHLPHP